MSTSQAKPEMWPDFKRQHQKTIVKYSKWSSKEDIETRRAICFVQHFTIGSFLGPTMNLVDSLSIAMQIFLQTHVDVHTHDIYNTNTYLNILCFFFFNVWWCIVWYSCRRVYTFYIHIYIHITLMHACMHTYIYMHAFIHTCIHTYIHYITLHCITLHYITSCYIDT